MVAGPTFEGAARVIEEGQNSAPVQIPVALRRKGEEGEMKAGRVAIVGILFIAMLVVSGANADKPEGQVKAGKAPSTSECIVFTEDLKGAQVVEGCCGNRGPFPEYTMTLSGGILTGIPAGEYSGNVFMNRWGTGRIYQYIVQFWTPNDAIFLAVKGGVVREETKNKLTVDFDSTNSVCWDYSRIDPEPRRNQPCEHAPTFTLVRTSNLSLCPSQ